MNEEQYGCEGPPMVLTKAGPPSAEAIAAAKRSDNTLLECQHTCTTYGMRIREEVVCHECEPTAKRKIIARRLQKDGEWNYGPSAKKKAPPLQRSCLPQTETGWLIERDFSINPDCMYIGYVESGKDMANFITWTSQELAIRFAREEDAKKTAEALSRLILPLGIQNGYQITEHSWGMS